MKKLIFGCFCIILTAISCKKNESDIPTPVLPSPFMTFAPGTVWNYNTHDSIYSGDTSFTFTSTSEVDTIISGKAFHVFTNQNDVTGDVQHEYYNISGNDYYQYSNVAYPLPALTIKYLSTDSAVGQILDDTTINSSLEMNGSTVSLTTRIITRIEEKNSTYTVNNINYDSVIKVRTEIPTITASVTGTFPPIPFPVTVNIPIIHNENIHTYYAPRVGQIRRDYSIHATADLSNLPAAGLPSSLEIINTNKSTTLVSCSIQ